MWTEIYVDTRYTDIMKVMKACHNAEERPKWDTGLMTAEIVQIPKHNILIWHQMNKSSVKIVNQRDFLEKKVKFEHEGKQYIYYSSVPEDF